MHYLVHIPEYFYLGLITSCHWAVSLPWPTGADWFRWALFFTFGKGVWWLVGRRYKTNSEQGAAAGVTSLFEHH